MFLSFKILWKTFHLLVLPIATCHCHLNWSCVSVRRVRWRANMSKFSLFWYTSISIFQKNHLMKPSKALFESFSPTSLGASISRFYGDIEVLPNSRVNGKTACDKSPSKGSELDMLASCDWMQTRDVRAWNRFLLENVGIPSFPTKTWNEKHTFALLYWQWRLVTSQNEAQITHIHSATESFQPHLNRNIFFPFKNFKQNVQVCAIIPRHCIVELDPRLLGGGSVIFQIQPARWYSADTQLAASSSWRRRVKVSKDKLTPPPPASRHHCTPPLAFLMRVVVASWNQGGKTAVS